MIGLGIILAAEVLLFLKVEPIPTFFTPIAWTGYILAVDSLVFKVQGQSLIRNRSKELWFMLPLSVFVWLCFEGYNLHLKNWHYINLPANPWIRWLGFCWSFATILPAILETTELYSSLGLFEVPKEEISKFGIAEFDGEFIKSFIEKPKEHTSNIASAAYYVIEPEAFDYMSFGRHKIEHILFPRLAKMGEMRGVLLNPKLWIDIGTYHSYMKANKMVEKLLPPE